MAAFHGWLWVVCKCRREAMGDAMSGHSQLTEYVTRARGADQTTGHVTRSRGGSNWRATIIPPLGASNRY